MPGSVQSVAVFGFIGHRDVSDGALRFRGERTRGVVSLCCARGLDRERDMSRIRVTCPLAVNKKCEFFYSLLLQR